MFCGAASQQLSQQAQQNTSLLDSLNTSLTLFDAYATAKKKQPDPFQSSMVPVMLDNLDSMSRFINVLISDDGTKNMMNLLIHSWVQARGLHAAAEGFKPGASAKAPVKSTNLAVIFAKLWHESTPSMNLEIQKLKPFGSAVVSAGLQIGK